MDTQHVAPKVSGRSSPIPESIASEVVIPLRGKTKFSKRNSINPASIPEWKPNEPTSDDDDPSLMTRFQSTRAREILDTLDRCGDPIFQAKDILTTTDMFAKLVRMFCVERDVTWDYFYARHRAYCESMGYAPHQINYDRNNCKRALIRSTMTKNYFEYFCQAMGIIIIDMSISLVTPDGVTGTYRLTDAERISRMRITNIDPTDSKSAWDEMLEAA